MAYLLEVDDLHTFFKTKKGIVKAVNGVSYRVESGKTLGIVGESGSGKSVSAMSILKLLDGNGYIDSGTITFKGRNLAECTINDMYQIRGNEISVIFQEPMTSLNPVYTIEKQLNEVYLTHQKITKKEASEKSLEMLKAVKIPNPESVMKQFPHQLSGGMRQRCVLATALASNPKLLIADEPTTALDVTIQAEILKLLKKLQKELNLSILFITHDLGVVAQIADRVAVMQNGKIVELEEAKQLFTAPKHSYTKKLIQDHPYYMHRNESKLISESELHEKLVEISHLSYFYPLDRKRVFQAVKDVSFEIRRDEIFGLVGESGSGKSTVGKCLMGILNPEAETFSYDGINLLDKKAKKKNARRLQKERQMIFQDSTSSLNQKMKVEKILAEPLEIHKVFSDKKEQHDFLCEMMEEVELQEEQLHVWPPELSGGQRQRVAIARAFVQKTEIILLDEATSSLDNETQLKIQQAIENLQKEYTILIIAHRLSTVRNADRILMLSEGKIIAEGNHSKLIKECKKYRDLYENEIIKEV